jgi:hypothetical protein
MHTGYGLQGLATMAAAVASLSSQVTACGGNEKSRKKRAKAIAEDLKKARKGLSAVRVPAPFPHPGASAPQLLPRCTDVRVCANVPDWQRTTANTKLEAGIAVGRRDLAAAEAELARLADLRHLEERAAIDAFIHSK